MNAKGVAPANFGSMAPGNSTIMANGTTINGPVAGNSGGKKSEVANTGANTLVGLGGIIVAVLMAL